MPTASRTILLTLALSACVADTGLLDEPGSTDAGDEETPGALSCTDAVDFGLVALGSCATRPVRCDATEPIEAVAISVDPPFAHDAVLPAQVAPGATLAFEVRFCPEEPLAQEGELRIEYSDGVDTVRLVGQAGAPSLSFSPASIDFGRIDLGDQATERLTIENGGAGTLEVELTTAPPFSLSKNRLTLPPGDTSTVDAAYAPAVAGDHPATITLYSNDPARPTATIDLIGRAEAEVPCSLDVAPASLPFGEVALGDQLVLSFGITNLGTTTCLIRDLRTSGAAFHLTSRAPRSVDLEAGASIAVAVRFAPSNAGSFLGEARFDAAGMAVTVPLSGQGVDSSLTIRPADVDFGTTTPECPASAREVTLDNRGLTGVQVTSVAVEPIGAPFTVVTPSLPFPVPTDDTRTFTVEYAPSVFRLDISQIVVRGTIDGEPFERRVGLRGRYTEAGENVDTFVQNQTDEVDVLIVMDNSNTMLEEQEAIGANFASFIQYAEQGGLDYQIGVTTTDIMDQGGRLVPIAGPASERIITPASVPSPAALFEQNVDVGTTGALLEQGLEAAYLALSPPIATTHNAGFLRSDAVLLLIFVSDENDGSPRMVSFYADFFLALKNGDPALVKGIAIIGDVPAGCATATGGLRYDALVSQVGGDVVSICSTDWSATLSQISRSAFGLRASFTLSGVPNPSTIEVRVDGVITSGWTYDDEHNRVVFDQLPPQGASIEIRYELDCP